MRIFFRFPLIAALILISTILLLPKVKATSGHVTPAAIASSSLNQKAVRGRQFRLAASTMPEDEEVFADLSVTKLVDSEQATPGMNLTYTITVHNGESFSVNNVTLNDELPAGLNFVSLTKPNNWTCTTPLAGSGGTVNCLTPSLAANANDVFTLVAQVPLETAPGTSFTNIATVSSLTTPDSNEENNSAPATSSVMVKNADLGVTKQVDLEQVTPGENLTYTITVRSGEPFSAENVTLSDTLPGDTTFVSLTKPDSWACTTPATGAGGTITCTNPSLAINSEDVFILVVNVPQNAQFGTSYTNTAVVASTTADPNEENNSSTVTTTIASADLEVIKADTPDPAGSGSELTYTITLKNNGPDSATDVTMSDTLPAGTTFVSLSSPGGWLCSTPAVGSGGVITCTTDSLAVGNSVFMLTVKIDSGVSSGTVLTNSATVSSKTYDSVPGNNTGTATTTIVNLRGWTTVGDSSVTEDEGNPARPVYTNFIAAVSPGSPAGVYVLRYNIQAMDGLAGAGANTRLRVRFRDEGEGSRVIVAIVRSSITGGVATLGTIFDSNAYAPSNNFQTQEILMPAQTFDFTQNFYWLEVILTKSGQTNQPGFGSAQINRQ